MDNILEEISKKYNGRRIIFAWPSGESMHYKFVHSLLELVSANIPFFNLGLSNSISSRVAVNRNECVRKARQLSGTDILWMDGDCTFPINGLIRLLAHDKDIVCATTRRRDNRGFPVGVPFSPNAPQVGGLVDMKLVGFPFMLIKMSVFDKLELPYFAEPPRKDYPKMDVAVDDIVGEDEYFCFKAREAGYQIWCDPQLSAEIGHVGYDVKYIESQYCYPVQSATQLMGDL